MKILLRSFFLVFVSLIIIGCSKSDESNASKNINTTNSRWYNAEQVSQGAVLYQNNCSVCHKKDASGHGNISEDGTAPALNGSEHTWHHPMSILVRTVKKGGVALGGTMPAFEDKLNNEEIISVIAWLQSHWPEKQYALWNKRNSKNE